MKLDMKKKTHTMRTTFHYPEGPYGRTYADVITKISRMDSLPNYLSYGAPLERASRAQGAPLKIKPLSLTEEPLSFITVSL